MHVLRLYAELEVGSPVVIYRIEPMPPNDEKISPEVLYLLAGDPAEFGATLGGLRAADLAEALNHLPAEAAARVVKALPFDLAVQVLDEPGLGHELAIFTALDDDTAVPLIEAMSADQQADLFRELEGDNRNRLLPVLAPEVRETLENLLRYPPDTAGGIMTTEFVAVPDTWSARQTLQYIHDVGRTKETVYAIYVVDAVDRLVHVVSLREVIAADRQLPVIEVGDRRKPIAVAPLVDREEVTRLISKYNMLAIPVVDPESRILGIVTVDDVIDALVAEQTEDAQKFGGMEALDAPYMQIGFFSMLKKRAGWLSALFIGETLTATAMGRFEEEIATAVVLALFIPLIISSGGNSGGQSTSLIIRALALREVKLGDWWRVLLRELPTGLTLGAILGLIGALRILLWQLLGWHDYGPHHNLIAATIFFSLIGIVAFGSTVGSMLPFIFRRVGFDPASASAPFVATLVDVTGIVIYFTVAAVILQGTLL